MDHIFDKAIHGSGTLRRSRIIQIFDTSPVGRPLNWTFAAIKTDVDVFRCNCGYNCEFMIRRPFTSSISRYAGPQTLAVLSCALALLAVNPSGFSSAQPAPAPLTRVQGQLPNSEAVIITGTSADATMPNTPSRLSTRKTKFSTKAIAAQSSTILQTVAFLNAALISHFTPLTASAVVSPYIQTVLGQIPTQPQFACNVATHRAARCDGATHEQAFVRTHCLLAPPV